MYRTKRALNLNVADIFSFTECTAQGKDFALILTLKMETRHSLEGPFGTEFLAIWNHC